MTPFLSQIDKFFAFLGGRIWVWLGILLFMTLYGLYNHVYMMGYPSCDIIFPTIDPDVYLRLAKIRTLIADGNLYNHAVPAANAPYGGVESPWTHPVDFMVIALTQLMPSDVTIEKRLLLTAVWYPLIIGTLIIYFLGKAAETGFRSLHKFIVVLLGIASYYFLFGQISYFAIGNVDHHSLQTLLFVITLWLLIDRPTPLRGLAMGTTMGLWIWISPEAVPFIFAIYVILGINSLLNPFYAKFTTITSLCVTAVSLIGLSLELPLDKFFISPAYDTLSIVHVIFFAFCATGFLVLLLIVDHIPDIKKRFIAATGTAAVLVIGFLSAFPKFIKGPMAEADPYIISHFLPHIYEATPLLTQPTATIINFLFLPALALLLCVAIYKKHPKLLVILTLSIVMTLFQMKWSYYLMAVSIVTTAKLLPSFMRSLRRHMTCNQKILTLIAINPYIVMITLCLVTSLLLKMMPIKYGPGVEDCMRCDFAAFNLITSGELQRKLGDQLLTYESSVLGNSGIAFFTPYHYVSGPYHREGAYGMQDQNAIFGSSSLDDIRPILKKRGINAILICPLGGEEVRKSWVNEYFWGNTPKDRNWVTIDKDFKFSQKMTIPVKPILLTIKP